MKVSVNRKRTSIQATIIPKRINTKKWRDDVIAETDRVFKEAAIRFVQVASERIPSLTGQAKAAFINIARSLGVDPGVTPDDPPESENIHLFYYLTTKGNTVQRGYSLSHSEIINLKTRVKLVIDLEITSAHNGFDYFTFWDQRIWHSLDEAIESMNNFVDNNFVPPDIEVTDG